MKYYYKTPEQLQKEIQEHIQQHKVSPYNKTFVLIFLNIMIIFITFLILDKAGLLHDIFSIKSIKSISYEIRDDHLILYFDVHRSIILTSKSTKDPQIFTLEEIRIKTLQNEILSKKVEIPKTIIDKESPSLRIPLNLNIDVDQIQEVYVVLNHHLIQLKKIQNKF